MSHRYRDGRGRRGPGGPAVVVTPTTAGVLVGLVVLALWLAVVLLVLL